MKSGKPDMPVYAPIDPDESMDALGHRIQRYARSHHPALVDDQGTLDWGGLVTQANRIANRLRVARLQPGDSVAALSGNSREDIALFLGGMVAGGCIAPVTGILSDQWGGKRPWTWLWSGRATMLPKPQYWSGPTSSWANSSVWQPSSSGLPCPVPQSARY